MKKILAVQITALILISGVLSGMFVFTDVYDEAYSRIVSVICLSCIKLNRVYSIDYEFETANQEPHPEFIIDDLEKGPIFISFRTDVCDYCDYMEPLIKQIFNLSFEKEDVFSKQINFSGTDITFYHINKDHAEAELKTLQPYYDIDGDEAVPMFTIITLEYHQGIILPYYLTFYGILDPNYTNEQRIEEITNNILNAIELYKENRQGFIPEDFKK
jgi:thiol-disulfide isomerase/thioredoxin